ncbi:MAG TPA: (d)CMP kinase [Mariprofundaceae bacterium]|nr:(d)CMP kinase [Mariprofundaceae bacterium]
MTADWMPVTGLQVAIDGPSGSGKGTAAAMLAERLGLPVLDSGRLYRHLAAGVVDRDIDPADEAAVLAAFDDCMQSLAWDGEQGEMDAALRSEAVGATASQVAAMQAVRDRLLTLQRDMAAKGCVMDGRDIGTVVLPDAQAKFYLTASVRERAHRRWTQLRALDGGVSFDSVIADLKERDRRDTEREHAPLRQAGDAVRIDSTTMRADEVADRMLAVLERRNLIRAAG